MKSGLTFKQADSQAEFEQIHQLNYRTFAEEIGQYAADGSGLLIDRFHDRNKYFIALQSGRVIGMVAANDQPPFSVESRLADPAILTSLGGPLLEVRLLAVEPDCRNRLLVPGLLLELYRYARANRYSYMIISGITTKLPMYTRLGFRALGPAVGCGAAAFVPMAMSLGQPPALAAPLLARRQRVPDQPLLSLMPGPVEVAQEVREAFLRPPISHRSQTFCVAWQRVVSALRTLASGMETAVMTGSGTTGNDAVALHLQTAFSCKPGLILINGEFGERLAGQAARAGLTYEELRWPWGQPWNLEAISHALTRRPAWIWAVHLETSTGILNPLGWLRNQAGDIPLAADCVSSLGAVPIPRGLWMASGVSGKALGSYSGLSFVFASEDALDRTVHGSFPATFDVRSAVLCSGPRFTVPSPLLFALDAALGRLDLPGHKGKGTLVRTGLRSLGITPLADEQHAAPCVTTFTPPDAQFLDRCRALGFEPGCGGSYLRGRGWAQIATMGNIQTADLQRLFTGLAQ